MTDTMSPPPARRMVLLGGADMAALAAAGLLHGQRDRFGGAEMTPPEALAASRAGDLLLVDIRRPDEWERTGIAESAKALDRRRDDFVSALTALTGGDFDAPVALICAAGVRSDRTGARLAEAGFTRVIDVSEGMLGSTARPGWLARDLPVMRP